MRKTLENNPTVCSEGDTLLCNAFDRLNEIYEKYLLEKRNDICTTIKSLQILTNFSLSLSLYSYPLSPPLTLLFLLQKNKRKEMVVLEHPHPSNKN
jgi:hypothetical protein